MTEEKENNKRSLLAGKMWSHAVDEKREVLLSSDEITVYCAEIVKRILNILNINIQDLVEKILICSMINL